MERKSEEDFKKWKSLSRKKGGEGVSMLVKRKENRTE